jgi:hypothetical protein
MKLPRLCVATGLTGWPTAIPEHSTMTDNACAVGIFSKAPRLTVRTASGAQKQHLITVERAPEPGDFWWHNCTAAGWRKQMRYLAGWALWVLLLAVSAAIQFLLTRLAENERSKRIELARSGTSSEVQSRALKTASFSGLGQEKHVLHLSCHPECIMGLTKQSTAS